MVDELHVDRYLMKSVHRSHLDSASGAGNRDDISDKNSLKPALRSNLSIKEVVGMSQRTVGDTGVFHYASEYAVDCLWDTAEKWL
jgi:hypothetical protein